MHVHSNTIHNSQKVETAQMSINKHMDKLWYIHTMEYYSAIKKEWITDICYNMDRYYAKWKKSDTKGHILYDYIYMKHPEQINP